MVDEPSWNPRIVAALALGKDHFVVAYGELDYDDPFTAVLEYNAAYPQPWARTDIGREIKALTRWIGGDPAGARFVALSDEGDVYFIGEQTVREKIAGAGVASPDATGDGSLFGLANVGGTLYAAGQGEQVFRRAGPQRWDRLSLGIASHPEHKRIAFQKIVGRSEQDAYLLGVAAPALPQLDAQTEQSIAATDDWGALFKAHDDLAAEAGLAGRVDEGRVFHTDGSRWRAVDLPTAAVLNDLLLDTPDRIYMVGTGGTILEGNPVAGFRLVTTHNSTDTFLSITRLGSLYYLASDYALHTFDGRVVSPLKPRLRRGPPTPFGVQAVDDVVFYFDYKQGVQRFDGRNWERIDIPPDLLQRRFKGLPRPAP
jgi:hypothetical protein